MAYTSSWPFQDSRLTIIIEAQSAPLICNFALHVCEEYNALGRWTWPPTTQWARIV